MFGEAPDLTEYFEDPPDCEGCSVGEAQVVWEAELKALEMLDCVLNKLENFDGNTPSDVKNSMESYFNSSSNIATSIVESMLRFVRFYPYSRSYAAQNNEQGTYCGPGGTTAWSFPLTRNTDVRLCRPNYWNQSPLFRATDLIHEWMHLYAGRGDLAYDWEPEFQELNTLEAILNADSYAEFVKNLCP